MHASDQTPNGSRTYGRLITTAGTVIAVVCVTFLRFDSHRPLDPLRVGRFARIERSTLSCDKDAFAEIEYLLAVFALLADETERVTGVRPEDAVKARRVIESYNDAGKVVSIRTARHSPPSHEHLHIPDVAELSLETSCWFLHQIPESFKRAIGFNVDLSRDDTIFA